MFNLSRPMLVAVLKGKGAETNEASVTSSVSTIIIVLWQKHPALVLLADSLPYTFVFSVVVKVFDLADAACFNTASVFN